METLKNKINSLVELQKSYKSNRKTVNFVGERQFTAYEAQWKHSQNREILRELNIVAGMRNGHLLSEIEVNPKVPFTEQQVEKILERWKDFI